MKKIDEIREDEADLSLLKDIPISYAMGNMVMPMRIEDGLLVGAVTGERGALALREIALLKGLRPEPLLASEDVLRQALNRAFSHIGSAEEVMGNIADEDFSSVATEFERPKDILELTEDAPIIRLLNALFRQAVKERASDIHIEPYENDLEVRTRVDGVLHKVLTPPKIIQDALISRVKIMANLDIAEKRLPQDGRIRLLIGGRDIDIRVSIIPTIYGERAVLRLLDRKQGLLGLKEVGAGTEDKQRIEELITRQSGIVLVTGPTGSGKTTTLYACLNRIHTEDKNIITVEDPVEYQLKGIGQINVNPKIGLSFASGLRSILRQDPDVIMVGEIRDFETAEIAIQASLTGHLVLSTLHTNDAPSAVARLLDMGIEPFLVATSLAGVVAQRLVRVICPACKEEYAPTESEMKYFASPPAKLFRGRGCRKCGKTGYSGRTGIFEFLVIDNDIRHLITARSDAQSIKDAAVKKGMKGLREDGLGKASKGITTLEEVLRISQKDHADISI